jgi:hypothetical protein
VDHRPVHDPLARADDRCNGTAENLPKWHALRRESPPGAGRIAGSCDPDRRI